VKLLTASDEPARDGTGEQAQARAASDERAQLPGTELPHEPSSPAGLLSASHIFVVEVVGILSGGRAPLGGGPGSVEMALRLESILKGRLDVGVGTVFLAAPRPADETGLHRDDGLAPQVQPWIGGRYVVVARGPGTARTLVAPRACRAVLPSSCAGDVAAAAEAQAAFADTTRSPTLADADLEACRELVRFAELRSNALHRPFAAFLLARLAPPLLRAYRSSPRPPATGPLVAALFALLSAPGLTGELRAHILGGVTRLAARARSKGLSRDFGRALLHELIAGRGEPGRLVYESIYPILFDVRGRPRLRAWEVMSDPQRRERASQALTKLGGERALRISAWLLDGAPK
jgi:hypothetical protein